MLNVRNKGDAAIAAIAETGGIVGICYLPPIVAKERATFSELTKHAVYLKNRMGASGLAIGSDFIDGQPASRYTNFVKRPEIYGEWPWRYPVDSLAAQQEWLTSLQAHGFSSDEIAALASRNALRVLKQAWSSQ